MKNDEIPGFETTVENPSGDVLTPGKMNGKAGNPYIDQKERSSRLIE